jgi:hypothetical protein
MQLRARLINFASHDAILCMVVHQTHCLHEGIDGSGADEFPATLAQFLRQRFGGRRGRTALWLRPIVGWLEPPDKCCEGTFTLDQIACAAGIVDGGLYLAAMTDDPGIYQQPFHVGLVELRYLAEVEPSEGSPEILALGQDGPPAKSRFRNS